MQSTLDSAQMTTRDASAASSTAVLEANQVHRARGLTAAEAQQRLEQYGPNKLREAAQRSAWSILIEQFKSIIVLLLVFASALAFAFGDVVEGFAVLAVIFINAAIGFFTELRAVRSMEALQQLGHVSARVRRDGQMIEIDAEQIVPGDILIFEGGDVVTADARLLEAAKLQVNESALTGESLPVDKQVEALGEVEELAERRNMIFKGTAITRGSGEAIVITTGMKTELGHISSLVEAAEDETTPLEQRLAALGRKLVWLTLVVAVLVIIAGVISGKDLILMIETAIALAVASIPEGLPIVATIALARGMQRMAARNALINKLSIVETLGATNIICTDKTGTLTENQMTVSFVALATGEQPLDRDAPACEDSSLLRRALRIGVLCNNASLNHDHQAVGEPLEVALLQAGARCDLYRQPLNDELPEVREIAFDNDTNMMATIHRMSRDEGYYVAVKGAPEAVIRACTRVRGEDGAGDPLDENACEAWIDRNDRYAADGLRMLAVAEKQVASADAPPYEDLTLVGLIGLLDPPREDVRDAIAQCRSAGIRLIMITGDQPATARTIALETGLAQEGKAEVVRGRDLKAPDEMSEAERHHILETSIFARVNPEQKLNLIGLHQANGARVAMTGDGVNDAPALKKADIGIAMGQRGTQVAQEAADMVLKDDALSTIVVAVRQGRIIFDNIRRFVLYLLSCNISEILIVGLASLVNAPLPIQPLQILFINLVTDVFPALALGVGEGDQAVMKQPPRDPDEPIIRRQEWLRIGGYSVAMMAGVLGVYAYAMIGLELETQRAITIAFMTLAFAQLWHVFNMRDPQSTIFRNDIVRNPWVWGALGLCTLLLLSAVYVPFMRATLDTVELTLDDWALVLVGSLVPLVVGQLGKEIQRAMASRSG